MYHRHKIQKYILSWFPKLLLIDLNNRNILTNPEDILVSKKEYYH